MNPRRLTTVALCRSVVLASCVVAWPQVLSSSELENANAAPVVGATAPADEAKPAETSQPAVADGPADRPTEPTTTAAAPAPAVSTTAAATPDVKDQAAAADKSLPAVQTASANPAEVLPSALPPSQDPTASTPDHGPNDQIDSISLSEATDECFIMDICVDRYLWELYLRAPKEDTIRVPEQRQVTIKRKRKLVTVTRTFFKPVDEDFAWKDRKASEKAGLPMEDYVIGGMDRDFKLKLFYTLHAAEAAGLSPGITSAFRDDYRQSIASGLKAASNRSYHGGSLRGGYGHGLAADIVSTKGATRTERWTFTEALWKWVDAHGKEFGIGRPYLSYDPPHVGPIDGQEYISRRGDGTTRLAYAAAKPRRHLAARHERGSTKHTKVASAKAKKIASAKAGRIRSARNSHSRARAT
jgi:hypothetical protein